MQSRLMDVKIEIYIEKTKKGVNYQACQTKEHINYP